MKNKLSVKAAPDGGIELQKIVANSVEEMAQKLAHINCLSFEVDSKTKPFSKQILKEMQRLRMKEHLERQPKRPVLQIAKRIMAYANRLDEALQSDGWGYMPMSVFARIEDEIENLWRDSQVFRTMSDFEQPESPRRWSWYVKDNPQLFADEKPKSKRTKESKKSKKKGDRPLMIVNQKPSKPNGAATKKEAEKIIQKQV